MRVRFYLEPGTDAPHIWAHDVTEEEVEEVLRRPIEDWPGRQRARFAIGQTLAGRVLQIIYVPDEDPDSVFVVTAYDLRGKPLAAFRRRSRKKRR